MQLLRPFKTWFPFGSDTVYLNLATSHNSLARSTKSTWSLLNELPLLVSIGFQVLFHSPTGVLFTFPSRYLFTIGHRFVFSLGRRSSLLPTGFLVLRGTLSITTCPPFRLPDFHLLWFAFPGQFDYGFLVLRYLLGFSPFARRYLENRVFFLFVLLLRCFSSQALPSLTYWFG